MNNRNNATEPEATGVLAPLIRAATHIGWCIGYLGTIEAEELTQEQRDAIENDLLDALKHINDTETSNLLDAFVGDAGLALLRELREEMASYVPETAKNDVVEAMHALADNTAYSGAILERLMTGHAEAQAGRNL